VIVLLCYGDYSDYTVDRPLEVESVEVWNSLVAAYVADGHPYPKRRDRSRKWEEGLQKVLLASGRVTESDWREVHQPGLESDYRLSEEGQREW